jgi:hypothetical protein
MKTPVELEKKKKEQFSEEEREEAKNQVAELLNVDLWQWGDGHLRKLYKPLKSSTFYIIIGGYEWHGITLSLVETLMKRSQKAHLVIAHRHLVHAYRYELYVGDFQPLMENLYRLTLTRDGNLDFNLALLGDMIYVKEVPSCILRKIGEYDSKISLTNYDYRRGTSVYNAEPFQIRR